MFNLPLGKIGLGIGLAVPILFFALGMTALAQGYETASPSPSPVTSASTAATSTGGGLPGDPAKGQVLFANNCTSCHGANLEGGVGAKLNPILGGPGNLDPGYLITTITDGETGKFNIATAMPPKGGNDKLTDQDVKDLAAFIIASNRTKPTLSPQELAKSTVLWVMTGIIIFLVVTWLLATYNMRWIARRAKRQ